MLLTVATLLPATTHASVLGDILSVIKPVTVTPAATDASFGGDNVQTMTLLKPAMNIDPAPAQGGGDITIVDESALMPKEGPSGTIADIEKPKNATISLYVVREGDTLTGIAKMFDVSPNTIIWANDIPKSKSLIVGQTLTILPVTGIKYTVQKSDTLSSIAKRFGTDATEVANFNGIDGDSVNVGDVIVIPDAEASVASADSTGDGDAKTPKSKVSTPKSRKLGVVVSGSKKGKEIGPEPAHDVGPEGSADEIAYYSAPLSHYIETQGIHGYNAVDLAAPIGTPILAAADGDVVVAKEGGWNGGYGSYVVIQHDNGSQTLYGHASKVIVSDGQHVVQGQVIAYVGVTGESTGPHVHFEIRNGIKNPF